MHPSFAVSRSCCVFMKPVKGLTAWSSHAGQRLVLGDADDRLLVVVAVRLDERRQQDHGLQAGWRPPSGPRRRVAEDAQLARRRPRGGAARRRRV